MNNINFLIIINKFILCYSIVAYRPINPFGHTVAKWGYNCIDIVSEFYFSRDDEQLTRAKNVVITYSVNMSLPSHKIEQLFLKSINDDLNQNFYTINQQLDKNHEYTAFQIRVISDGKKLTKFASSDSVIQSVDFYAIVTDSFERFSNLFLNFVTKASSWNSSGKFLILYHNHKVYNQSNEISYKIFKLMYDNDVSHGVILYATNVSYYKIMHLDLFRQQSCRQITNYTVLLVGGCNDGKLLHYQEVKEKVKLRHKNLKLNNCTFTLCPRKSEPFIENNCTSGIELNLVNVIKKKLGFNLNVICMEERGMKENGTWTGILGKLKSKVCDFSVGGFYPDDDYVNNFWGSTPYFLDRHTWFVYSAPMREPWKGIAMIFKLNLWAACAGVFILTWMMWLFLGKTTIENASHESISLTGINTLGLILGVSVDSRPKFQPLKIFFVFSSIFGLVITTLYTSKLIAVFSNPAKDHQIQGMDEVIQANIPFGGPQEKQDWFTSADDDITDRLDKYILNHYNSSPEYAEKAENLEFIKNKKQVTLLARLFVLQSNYSNSIYPFPNDVFSSQVQMIFNRAFPLRIQFDLVLRDCLEFGIVPKLYDELIFNNTELKSIGEDEDTSAQPLTPRHISGAFAALFLGLSASLLVFLGELLSKYYIIDWINEYFGIQINAPIKKKQTYKHRKLSPIRFTPPERRKIRIEI